MLFVWLSLFIVNAVGYYKSGLLLTNIWFNSSLELLWIICFEQFCTYFLVNVYVKDIYVFVSVYVCVCVCVCIPEVELLDQL